MQSDKPVLIEGGISIDDRGQVTFCNSFDFDRVRRFYIVGNHRAGLIRAWHGHKREEKYVTAVQGSVLVAVVPWDGFNEQVQRFVLSAAKPAVLYIPANHFNGWMSLTENVRMIFFSTFTVEESAEDDVRFPPYKWNPWSIEER